MRVPSKAPIAGAVLVALVAGVAASSPDSPISDPTLDPVVIEAVADGADAIVSEVLESNLIAFEVEEPRQLDEPLARIDSAADAADALLEERELTQDMAAAILDVDGSALTVDHVAVEALGDAELVESVDGSVAATVDIQITRHIAEDDIDWVEVIPHELTIDAESGQVLDVLVKDLEHQLEESPGELVTDESLMTVPEHSSVEEPVALNATAKKKVVDYALKHAVTPNKKSYVVYSLDCTNFVSQALKAGGWKEVSNGIISYKSAKSWWYGGIPKNSWTWSGAENFYRMTQSLKRTSILPNVYQLRTGDVLQYKNKGSKTMTHSMVVTAKKSGTNGMPYLSYHTPNTKNKPFSSMKNKSVTWFAHRT